MRTLLMALCFFCSAWCLGADSSLVKADEYFQQRHLGGKAVMALNVYRAVYASGNHSKEVSWKLAMACQFVAMRLETNSDKQKELYAEGRDVALKAATDFPKCGPCHFWAAINDALYGQTVGIISSLFSLPSILSQLRQAAELDPKHAHGGAYRVMGVIYQTLPGMLGGDTELARDYFQKAINEVPKNALNYLFLARLWQNELDNTEKAIEVARTALKNPKPPVNDVESYEAWTELVTISELGKSFLPLEMP